MKLSASNRAILQVLGILGVGALTVTTMFFPEVLGNEHSVVSIEEKKANIEQLSGELRSSESILQSSRINLERVKEEAGANKQKAERLQAGIARTNFDLHMPSILVALEQKANAYNLELLIDYEKIQQAGAGGAAGPSMGEEPGYPPGMEPGLEPGTGEEPMDETPDGTPGGTDPAEAERERQREERRRELEERRKEAELGQGGPVEELPEPIDGKDTEKESEPIMEEELEKEPEATREETEPGAPAGEEKAAAYDPEKVDTSAANQNVPSIPGMDVTLVPVRVVGSYADVRSFIQYLDEVDFMEHNFIDLYSYGENVSGIIVFNVFHAQEGGGGFY